VLANLPTVQQYQELKRDRFLFAKFQGDMNERFFNDKYLHLKATDGALGLKLGNSSFLKEY